MTKIPAIVFVCLFSVALGAQDNPSASSRYNKYKIVLNEDRSRSTENFFRSNKDEMGLSQDDVFHLQKRDNNENGTSHLRYKQYYKGIPVLGGTYILHENNGQLISASGYFLPKVKLNTKPSINETAALKIIKQEIQFAKEEKDAWDEINLSLLNQPALWILDRGISQVTGKYYLVYEIDVEISESNDRQRYYIDAHEGNIILNEPLIHHQAVPGKVKTRYYGEQEVVLDSIDVDTIRLHDPTRGNEGIVVSSGGGREYHNHNSCIDFSQSDFTWGATDLLYCTSRFYDMLIEDFDWEGLDNENASFKSQLFEDFPFVNASWNGEVATFYNGDCDYGPLTTMAVIGHEFTHGIVDKTSNLIYAREPGAINESMADVIGKTLEYGYDFDNFSWEIGNRFLVTDQAESFRNMKDPLSKGHPEYYGGEDWSNNGGVHTNSSIGNRWFYLLSEGEIGNIPSGESYEVQGMGLLQAAQFIFYVNRNYLTEFSDYQSYYSLSLLAANEFFDDQEIIDNIKEAWKAVGLNDGDNPDLFDLAVEGIELEACEVGDIYNLICTVKNEGERAYLPSMMGTIELVISQGDLEEIFERSITTELLPGDSIEVDFGTYEVQIPDDYLVVTYRLEFEDDDLDVYSNNNRDFEFIFHNFYGVNDLEIRIRKGFYRCEDGQLTYDIRISNESCQDIEVSEPMMIRYTDLLTNEIVWEDEFDLDSNMPMDTNIYVERTIDVTFDEPKWVVAELLFANDPHIENNKNEIYLGSSNLVSVGYENGFDNIFDQYRDIVVEIPNILITRFTSDGDTTYIYNAERIFEWNNERWFYTTGSRFFDFVSNDCERYAHIEDLLDITKIISCVDFSGVEDPQLTFDLVQFYYEANSPSLKSCGLKVVWDGEVEGQSKVRDSVLIFDQPEAIIVNNRIELPSNFVGELRMIFYTNAGSEYSDDDFFQHDIIFMDNLKLSSLVSSEDLEDESSIKIYPNPTMDILEIESTVNMRSASIYNLDGQLMSNFILNKNKIYTGDLSPGIYLVKLVDARDNFYVKKVVKI